MPLKRGNYGQTMTDAVAGTYSDLKFIKTRGVAQIVIEVPIERAGEVVALLGTPMIGNEVWCAVARLAGPPQQSVGDGIPKIPPGPGTREAKPKREWDDIPPSEQAGIACADEGFQKWWRGDEKYAALSVRDSCGVNSRSKLDTNSVAAERWRDLYARFQRETGRVAEERR